MRPVLALTLLATLHLVLINAEDGKLYNVFKIPPPARKAPNIERQQLQYNEVVLYTKMVDKHDPYIVKRGKIQELVVPLEGIEKRRTLQPEQEERYQRALAAVRAKKLLGEIHKAPNSSDHTSN